jgi:hypothetical protein
MPQIACAAAIRNLPRSAILVVFNRRVALAVVVPPDGWKGPPRVETPAHAEIRADVAHDLVLAK